jgi:MarR family transcriptional repressor of emrRAB
MHDARTSNLLGAIALAVTDLVLVGAASGAGLSTSGAAALVVLTAAPDGVTVTELGRRVGLTQSAAVRLVDGLAARGLVERARSPGRAVPVGLTDAGRRIARELLGARGAALESALTDLSHAERDVLADLLARVLTRLYDEVGNAERMCRLCDRHACTAGAVCPVGAAERAKIARSAGERGRS